MINIDLICWKQKTKNGYPLKFRILDTISKRSKYINLKLYLSDLKHFNDKTKKIRKSFIDYQAYNKIIEQNRKEVIKEYAHLDTSNEIIEIIDSKINFIDFLLLRINTLNTQERFGYVKRFTALHSNLNKYLTQKKLTTIYFEDINVSVLTDFSNFLTSQGVSLSTQSQSYFKAFRMLYNDIIKNNQLHCFNPFTVFKVANDNHQVVKTLTEEQLKQLHIIQYPPLPKHCKIKDYPFEEKKKAFRSKLLFLFSVYNQGIRPKDLFSLKWSNIIVSTINNDEPTYLIYRMSKTKKDIKIELTNESLLILKYFMPTKDTRFRCLFEIPFNSKITINTKRIIDLKNTDYFTDNEYFSFVANQDNINGFKKDTYNKIEYNSPKAIQQIKIAIAINQRNDSYIFSKIDTKKQNKKLYDAINYETAKYNKELKILAKYIPLNFNLTGYFARHTFATLMMSQTKDVYLISKLLGHADIKITEKYLKSLCVNDYSVDSVKSFITNINKPLIKGKGKIIELKI